MGKAGFAYPVVVILSEAKDLSGMFEVEA